MYELENSMSLSELIEWGEYLEAYPLSEDRNEVQLAVLSQIHASSEKKKYSAQDFMVSGKNKEIKEMSGEELNDYILRVMR